MGARGIYTRLTGDHQGAALKERDSVNQWQYTG